MMYSYLIAPEINATETVIDGTRLFHSGTLTAFFGPVIPSSERSGASTTTVCLSDVRNTYRSLYCRGILPSAGHVGTGSATPPCAMTPAIVSKSAAPQNPAIFRTERVNEAMWALPNRSEHDFLH